jgi:hypothetical protein
MNEVMQVTIQEAMYKLLQYGFQECTIAANRQNSTEYLCAFERLGDERHVYYCCVTVDDLFSLLSLVEASTSH